MMKNKKILYRNILISTIFILILLASLSTLGCTNEQYLDHKGNYYLKAAVTASKITGIKEKDSTMKDNLSLNHLSIPSPLSAFGVGYYINDYVRVDLMLEHFNLYFNDEANNFEEAGEDIIIIGTKVVKRKAYGKSLLLNSYIDIMQRSTYSIFIGAGIGVTHLKEKVTHHISGNSMAAGQTYTFPLIIENFTSKLATNFNYALIIGTTIKINPQMNCELSYSWKDFGKTKYSLKDKEDIPTRNRYKGHHFSAGLRFDL